MSDLTAKEQTNVRAALRFLRARTGADTLAMATKADRATIRRVIAGNNPVSARLVVRTARLAGVGIDALLAAEYPAPGTCAHCGHRTEAAEWARLLGSYLLACEVVGR